MAEYMHLDGRGDDNAPATASTKKLAKIFICIVDNLNRHWHSTVVLLPTSYEAAAQLAFELFGHYTKSHSIKTIDLRYGNKGGDRDLDGHLKSWSDIEPETWPLIVGDGDEIRVFYDDERMSAPPEKSIIAIFLLDPKDDTSLAEVTRYIIIWPSSETYESMRQKVFHLIPSIPFDLKPRNISFTIRVQNGGDWYDCNVYKTYEWMETMRSLSENHVAFEIAVHWNAKAT